MARNDGSKQQQEAIQKNVHVLEQLTERVDTLEDDHEELKKDHGTLKDSHRELKKWAENVWTVCKWIAGVAGAALSSWLLKRYGE